MQKTGEAPDSLGNEWRAWTVKLMKKGKLGIELEEKGDAMIYAKFVARGMAVDKYNQQRRMYPMLLI